MNNRQVGDDRTMSEVDDLISTGLLGFVESMIRFRRDPDHRYAAGANTAPSSRAFEPVRGRQSDHRSVAGLLARLRATDTFLEGGPCSPRACYQDRSLATIARREREWNRQKSTKPCRVVSD
jgi:hypothetical protein